MTIVGAPSPPGFDDDSLRIHARQARAEIVRGTLRGAALVDLLRSIPFRDRDAWVDELLGLDVAPPDVADLPRGSVPYVPCGVEEILTMVLEAPVQPHDEIIDLGSGIGRVVMLAHLLSGARAKGIEIQEPLVQVARERCAHLHLDAVSFVHADASDADLDGSVFFLYAPFNGEMLTRVLRRLEDVARRRSIIVCAASLEFRDVAWLQPRATSCVSLTIYESRAR